MTVLFGWRITLTSVCMSLSSELFPESPVVLLPWGRRMGQRGTGSGDSMFSLGQLAMKIGVLSQGGALLSN